MIPVTWNPYEQYAVGAYRRKRSFRVPAVVLFAAVVIAVVAAVLVAVFGALDAPSSAVGPGEAAAILQERKGLVR